MSKITTKVVLESPRLVVDLAQLTTSRRKDLRDSVGDIRRDNSIFTKFPMEIGETKEKWKKRVQPLIDEEEIRGEKETEKDHLKRLFELKSELDEIAFPILKAICDVFSLREPTDEELEGTNWIDLKMFIYNVLDYADIPAGDFFVKS